MIDLSVKDLVKSFDADTNLLDGVSFDIQAGERVGLLGRNGAGKTTLFKILTGELDYNTGEVRFAPGRKVGLISQIPHYPAGYTVEDVLRTAFRELANIQSKMRRLEEQMAAQPDKALLAEYDALSTRFQTGGGYETDMQTDKICNGLGIPAAQRQQDFDSLSGGEKTRVNLARLLLEKTDILLLDEPTNHLDMHAVEWLEGYIEKFRGTVLTISHDRYFLDRVVTRIIELHDGKAEFYSGNYSFYVQEKQARFDLQLKQYEKEQAKLGQLGFTLERMKGWGINNRTLYRRAMSIQHRMERIEKTDRPTQEKTLRARFAQRDFFGDEVLSVKGLGKAYDGRTLFSDVELQVAGGERIALLGDNGTGKSTFLKLLLGEEAGAGRVKFGPTVKWAYLPQIIHFAHPERTLLDTMLYEKNCTVQTARDRLGAYLFEGEDVFKTVSSLSGGEQSRLRLCMLMDEKINLLVLDEPTNHLDMHAVEWLEEYISKFKGTVLTISHDRYFLDRVVSRVIEIHDGKAEFYSGNYSFYVQEKQARFELQLKQYEKEQAKLGQLGFTLERMKGWGINNRTLYRRAMSIQHRMDRIQKTDRPTQEKTMRARFAQREFFGDEVLSVKGLGKSFDGRTLFEDVELDVAGGERIALLGDNGTGKSTFLKVLLGELAPDCGKIKFGPTVKWAYLPQIIHFDHPERTLLDTMLYEKGCSVQTARDRLGAYLFEGEDVFKPVSALSGGEQSRLRLCMLMDEKINLLILDEPTNHLDIASREWVEDALEDYEGALIFVSHDRYFVDKFATRVWELEDAHIRDFLCGYQKYRAIKEKESIAAQAQNVPERRERKEKPKPTTPNSKAVEKKLRAVEREVEKQEAAVAAYDPLIEAAASDYQELARLMAEKTEAEEKLSQLMEQWEELSLALEGEG